MLRKCEKCGAEFAEGTEHACAPVSPARREIRALSACPECGAEFEGVTITRASEKLATLSEQNAALAGELDATKKKLTEAEAKVAELSRPASDEPPTVEQKRKRRLIFGASKRAAA